MSGRMEGRRWVADQWVRCACGHRLALHRADKPHPCRGRYCGCEEFVPKSVADEREAS